MHRCKITGYWEQTCSYRCITGCYGDMSDYSNALLSGSNPETWGLICTCIIMNDVTWNHCLRLCCIQMCKWIFLLTIKCFIRQLRLVTLWEWISPFHIRRWNPYHVEKGQLISWRMSDLTILARLGLCRKYQVNTSIFSSPRLFLYLVWKEWALGVCEWIS